MKMESSISSLIMDCIEDKLIYQNSKPKAIHLSKKAQELLVEEVKGITNFDIDSNKLTVFSGYPVNIDEYEEGIKITVY